MKRGITVTNTPGVLTEDTADMTMALILAVPRRLAEGAAVLTDDKGPAGRRPGCSATASGASGSASSAWGGSARRWRGAPAPSACRSTTTTAAACPPKIEEELEATYWESLDQMLARMDIISINCPHTPATYHLLSARRLKLIRPDAYVVNTARGEVIDENALVRLIADGEIAGAGLDVFEHEPAVNPKLLRLARAGKVVLLPHMGSATIEGPHRHGREGDRQHQDLHGRPQAAGPRAAVDAVSSIPPLASPRAEGRRTMPLGIKEFERGDGRTSPADRGSFFDPAGNPPASAFSIGAYQAATSAGCS